MPSVPLTPCFIMPTSGLARLPTYVLRPELYLLVSYVMFLQGSKLVLFFMCVCVCVCVFCFALLCFALLLIENKVSSTKSKGEVTSRTIPSGQSRWNSISIPVPL
jgi:hypothetical protein